MFILPVGAQDTTQAAITVADQVMLNGTILVGNVVSPQAGWVVIHAAINGQPGPTVGIAPVQAGQNQNVSVIIDALGATPQLIAELHEDTGQTGVYEFDVKPDTDLPVMQNGQPLMVPFQIAGIAAFPQMILNNVAMIGSVIVGQPSQLVITADNNGQPGTVLGSTLVQAGTTPAVQVPLNTPVQTQTLWATLSLSDATTGPITPFTINNTPVNASFNNTATPQIMTVLGAPLDATTIPQLNAVSETGLGTDVSGSVLVGNVISPAAGWVEVHADSGGHPGKMLGMVNIPQGKSTNITVPLDAQMVPAAPPTTLPATVWPMLHVDDGQPGVYEYLMVPGKDVPVVLNGSVLTYMISAPQPPAAAATAEVTQTATAPATAEVTAQPTAEVSATVTAAATDQATSEPTSEVTTQATTQATMEATAEATVSGG